MGLGDELRGEGALITATTETIREQAFLPLSSDIPAGVTIRQYRSQRARRQAPLVASHSMAELPEELSPRQVAELIGDGGAQLVDVREPYEHEAGRITGDVHIELDQLGGAADAIDRDRPVVFYCRSGSRSALAARAFGAAGYSAHNLSGGLEAWVGDGLPIEPDGGWVA
jgi:rhodanese-related sulfurtransferase